MFADLQKWAINALGLSTAGMLTSESPVAEVTRTLSVTAITAANNESILQCWQVKSPFAASSQKGITGASVLQLSTDGNTSLVSIPAHFDGGIHVAPALQYVVFISGLAHVTLPDMPEADSAWIQGGQGSNSIIFAADTFEVSAVGHSTNYPSDEETLAIPIKVTGIPEHLILHEGPCGWQKRPETSVEPEQDEL